jgi:hypothetical protein
LDNAGEVGAAGRRLSMNLDFRVNGRVTVEKAPAKVLQVECQHVSLEMTCAVRCDSHRDATPCPDIPSSSKVSNLAEQNQNQNDDQDQPQATGRAVAPAPTIGPCRCGSEQQQDQENQEDGPE